ncbi:MAG TPA: tripartite tricarboxylate transporter TctB family protein [Burkholderiales bacterium]|nr:tripartite tricarboxylate transporter TctB family protein [Burkholderiales bacterium]
MHDNKDRPAASTRTVELVVAALVIAFGATVMWDSVRLGARWGSDGPQAGYFPFYIGLLICLSAGIIFFRGLADRMKAAKPFVSRGQLLLVMKMLVPSIIYVILIKLAGIYVASTLFIAFFMRWLGKSPWAKTAAVALGVSVVFFVLFEVWFKVPLPKGPLEAWLGLD